jgi:hypothetical protein
LHRALQCKRRTEPARSMLSRSPERGDAGAVRASARDAARPRETRPSRARSIGPPRRRARGARLSSLVARPS